MNYVLIYCALGASNLLFPGRFNSFAAGWCFALAFAAVTIH